MADYFSQSGDLLQMLNRLCPKIEQGVWDNMNEIKTFLSSR